MTPQTDFERIAAAIRYLDAQSAAQPSLEDVAHAAGLSAYHFQRLFRRWAGISPKRFLQVLTLARASRLLQDQRSVLDVSLDVGMSGPARLHDLFVALEAVTPGEHKRAGEGLALNWGVYPGPFGAFFLAASPRGICRLAFLGAQSEGEAVEELRAAWPAADVRPDGGRLKGIARRIFAPARAGAPLTLHLQGTNFQVQVWRALLHIPPGTVATYGDVAAAAGRAAAVRAAGTAIGANPVAYLIPCHRVIRETGALGGYRWGSDRKQAMLAWEQARALRQPPEGAPARRAG
jgi:AraC family transcriptional regulator of adaptative response/methylated-DNA-[protein]-cysteine methyltransferase